MLRLRIVSLVCVCALVACFRPSHDGARRDDAGVAGSGGGGGTGGARHDAGSVCGNGILDPDEQCDGNVFVTMTNSCDVVTGGALPIGNVFCGPLCNFDTSNCAQGVVDLFPLCSEDPAAICDLPTRGDVCERLRSCSAVPRLETQRCEDQINLACVDCMEPSLEATSDDGGVVDCDPRCKDVCGLLALPPEDFTQCMELLGPFGRSLEQNACTCSDCMKQLVECVADDGCWFVVQCALRTGCADMDCLAPETCGPSVDLVGISSVGVSIALGLGSCMNGCPP